MTEDFESNPVGTAAKLKELEAEIEKLETALSPRLWTKEMSDAWHSTIPDTFAAFDELYSVAMAQDNSSE